MVIGNQSAVWRNVIKNDWKRMIMSRSTRTSLHCSSNKKSVSRWCCDIISKLVREACKSEICLDTDGESCPRILVNGAPISIAAGHDVPPELVEVKCPDDSLRRTLLRIRQLSRIGTIYFVRSARISAAATMYRPANVFGETLRVSYV